MNKSKDLKDIFDAIEEINTLSEKRRANKEALILDKSLDRNKVLFDLKKKGIGSSIYYPHPIPMLNYYKKKYGYMNKEFPNACEISYKSITLPVGPHLTIKHMDYISNCLKKIINDK